MARHDLVVIGAGLAGLCAALTAAEAGMSVRVVAKGMGATHWSAGSLDLLGYLPGSGQPVFRPLDIISDLSDDHPYRRLGSQSIARALDSVILALDAAGLAFVGAQENGANLWLPSAVGAARPTYLAPAPQWGGDLQLETPMLFVGFQGMRDYFPALIAENLVRQGHSARSILLPLDLLTPRMDANPVQLAHSVAKPERLQALAAALRDHVGTGERIGLPAILGVEHHPAVWKSLQKQVEAPIFEIPTLPPSVPGIRLHKALTSHLAGRGVRVEVGMAVIGYSAAGKTIEWVETETSARPRRHHAAAYLLATGGILGGGFTSDHTGRFWESIFDLPLTVPQDRSAWFRPHFLDPEGQPIFHHGLNVDSSWRPIGPDGDAVFTNLYAAGGLLAFADPIQERSLEGLAIATGVAAAKTLAAES